MRTSELPKSREVPRGVLFKRRAHGVEDQGSAKPSGVAYRVSSSVPRLVAYRSVLLRPVAFTQSAYPRDLLKGVFHKLQRTARTLSVERLVQRFASSSRLRIPRLRNSRVCQLRSAVRSERCVH
jgi:hypothetical protein